MSIEWIPLFLVLLALAATLGFWAGHEITAAPLETDEEELDALFKSGYDEGFTEGYGEAEIDAMLGADDIADGFYDEGYADGFEAGMNQVPVEIESYYGPEVAA